MRRAGATIRAAAEWRTNGELIADVARLGYLDGAVLDCTYGLGTFWTDWQPELLTRCDLDPAKSPDVEGGCDFRALPFSDAEFDAVVFDPRYKLNGTPSDPDARYGADAVKGWQDIHTEIREGIVQCARVLRVGGRLLVKCQDQVCSGAVRWQTDEFTAHTLALGFVKVDAFLLLGTARPQPMTGRRQKHAHGRPSALLVFEKLQPPQEALL